jgi:hypothetical protein
MSTRTSYGLQPEQELHETLAELRASFGDSAILAALNDSGLLSRPSINPAACEAVREVIGIFLSISPEHRAIAVDALAIAVGLSDRTQTSVAADHAVTRAAISRRVLKFADRLGLPPAGQMKSPSERLTYRVTNGRRNIAHA